jgi:hypothetical protein
MYPSADQTVGGRLFGGSVEIALDIFKEELASDTRALEVDTLLPREMADSDVSFSGPLKISNKVKKSSATMRIHSKWNLSL